MNTEDTQQDKQIDLIWRQLDKKVTWVVFVVIITIMLGLFVYFASADTGLSNKIDKNEERFYQNQQDINKQLSEMNQRLGSILPAYKITK